LRPAAFVYRKPTSIGVVTTLYSAAFATSQSGWAVGAGATILHTDDGGFLLLNGKLVIGKRKTMEYAAVANRLEMETNHFLRLFIFQSRKQFLLKSLAPAECRFQLSNQVQCFVENRRCDEIKIPFVLGAIQALLVDL